MNALIQEPGTLGEDFENDFYLQETEVEIPAECMREISPGIFRSEDGQLWVPLWVPEELLQLAPEVQAAMMEMFDGTVR